MQTGGILLAFIPVPNCAQVTMQYQIGDSDLAENVFAVQNTGSWDASHLTTLAGVFNTWNDTSVGGASPYGIRHPSTTLLQTTARDLTTQSSDVVVVPYPGSHAVGTGSGNQLNNGLTKAITARSGLAGRSQRGRTFVVGMASSALNGSDPNLVLAAYVNDWIGLFNALITDVTTANAAWTLSVISRRHNNAPRTTGVTTPITSYGNADLYVDFQRRRAPGHSRHH